MELDSDLDEDDSDLEPSARVSEATASEERSPARDFISSSQKLRDELEAMDREYKVKSETLKRAIGLLENDE